MVVIFLLTLYDTWCYLHLFIRPLFVVPWFLSEQNNFFMFIHYHNFIQSLDGSQHKTTMKRNQTGMVVIQICVSGDKTKREITVQRKISK